MRFKRVFISADHGLAIIYFLQSDVVSSLLEAGIEVILLTDDGLLQNVKRRFGRPNLIFEGLRMDLARKYAAHEAPEVQWWLNFLCRVGCSRRINTKAMDSFIHQVAVEQANRRRILMPLAWLAIGGLRWSSYVRQTLTQLQQRFTPMIYSDLFDRYRPDLVIASTSGRRLDRYLLREAAEHGVPTASVVVGWDNPSSYGIPRAPVEWITCWSEIQKDELVLGSDWQPDRVNIGGIPSYDGYFRREWCMDREDYFHLHNLDPARKLLSYACSFVSYSPNLQNVEALVRLVASDSLIAPVQLLLRLHPNHFQDVHLFVRERERIFRLAEESPHVHVVEPVPLGGKMGYYSGEDMPEKASMMAHSDVFLTVYSTMVVETAIHNRPIISVCLDTPGGWNTPRKYSLPLSRIGDWPTHLRFRKAGAGKVVYTEDDLQLTINYYLSNPEAGHERRQAFVANEVTFTDGYAGRRTSEFLRSLL